MKKNRLLLLATALVLVLSGALISRAVACTPDPNNPHGCPPDDPMRGLAEAGVIADEKPSAFESTMDNESPFVRVPAGIAYAYLNSWVWDREYFLENIAGKHGGPFQGDLAFHIMEEGNVLFSDTNSDTGKTIVTIVYGGNLYECDPYHHNNLHDREGDHVFGACFPMIHKQLRIHNKSPFEEAKEKWDELNKEDQYKLEGALRRICGDEFTTNPIACIDIKKFLEECKKDPDCDPPKVVPVPGWPEGFWGVPNGSREYDQMMKLLEGGMMK